MRFNACCGKEDSYFAVPAQTVDMHINNASGTYFKVLLVLLRNQSDNLTSADIASMTSIPLDEVEAAARYWIKCKILPETIVVGAETSPKKLDTSVSPKLSAQEVAKLVSTNREIAFLFDSVESLFGRPVTATEQKVLVSMNEWLDLPVDVILMLIEYCMLIGKKSIRYIEKMAVGWADEGIVTHELAELRIKQMKEKDTFMGKVMAAFGIHGRTLTANEKKYITRWGEEFKFPMDMIQRAYEITVDNTGKVAFPYINKILASWYEKGYRTLADTEQEDRPKSTKGRIIPENDSFDVDAFESMGLYEIPDVKEGN